MSDLLKKIEYALRKDSLSDAERIASARLLVSQGLNDYAPQGLDGSFDIPKLLQDPAFVHLNMLRGGIAKLLWANIKHLYPEQFADNANSPDVELQRSAAMIEWQDIGSAPKDGTTILVWRPRESDDYPAHVGIDFWQQNAWWRSRRHQTPTHWMPLPAPPIARKDGETGGPRS